VPRILLVDDSESTRRLLTARLVEHGFEVESAPEATSAAERAMAHPPDAVVTDLWMPGISGVQLCRLLRAEPSTAHVPIVLLTASADRRTRFWARCAGAAAYVSKSELDELVRTLRTLTEQARERAPESARRGPPRLQERLSNLLDQALYEATIAGEVRSLAQHAEDPERLFGELARVASEVLSYRWLALRGPVGPTRIHTSPEGAASAEAEAREALGLGASEAAPVVIVSDDRALSQPTPSTRPRVLPVRLGSLELGAIACSPAGRGASREDEQVMAILASELGGALRMAALVHDTQRLAATDALTGLMNRRAFLAALEREHSRASRHALPLSLLMIDVDHFKRVNDTHGHDAGDAVLRAVAAALTRGARRSDLVARWGGEEFVAALPQTAEVGGRVAAERLRRTVAEVRHPMKGGEPLIVTVSLGLASALKPATIEELLARADRALYAAKERGRNRVEVG
jgi:two-component system cell cycle response regulator